MSKCVERKVIDKQSEQKKQHDKKVKERKFVVGQRVIARNYGTGSKWKPGVIVRQNGPLSYLVKVEGMYWKRHVDQLRDRHCEEILTVNEKPEKDFTQDDTVVTELVTENQQPPNNDDELSGTNETLQTQKSFENTNRTESTPTRRYPEMSSKLTKVFNNKQGRRCSVCIYSCN